MISLGGEALRVLVWNISHGGGSRLAAICHHIAQVRPDLLAFTEFQIRNEVALRGHLLQLGYPFIVTSSPAAKQNGLLVASRWSVDPVAGQEQPAIDRERWLPVRVNQFDLDVLVLHIPGTPDNKFQDGYGISGAKRKELLWERANAYAQAHKDRRAIIMGDFNTGFRIDTEGEMFAKSHCMTTLIDLGFVDSWRRLHPHERDYTWYSKRKDKATGKSLDLNGFRLDYIFASPALQPMIADAAILHQPRILAVSDHASVVADINIGKEGHAHIPVLGEISTVAPREDGSDPELTSESIAPSARPISARVGQDGNLRARIDLPPGTLPDMKCGINGQDLVQDFRPTYITAEWVSCVLKEVRIWGPRVLQDGSVGRRELDHVWKRSAAEGGVNDTDLPPVVAARLRSYITTNRRDTLPQ